MRQALEMALEALELMYACYKNPKWVSYKQQEQKILEQTIDTITAIKEALAQPEQEPVAWMQITKYGNKLLAFTEPPLEPPCYTGEFIAAKNYPLFLKKENT